MHRKTILVGLLVAALWGGGSAYAQSNNSSYHVNPSLLGTPGAYDTPNDEQGQFALGYTLTGYRGVVGHLELGRVNLSDTVIDLPEFGSTTPSRILDETNIEWNVSPRLTVASGFRRQTADPRFSDQQFTEDTYSGGVALSITPRLRVTAAGAVALRTESGTNNYTTLNGDAARVGATYSFLPGLQGSVNYTYESYDGQVGSLAGDADTTLSLSVTGQF